jgi:hypothetical protein
MTCVSDVMTATVVGVISEADLVAARDKEAWRARTGAAAGQRWHGGHRYAAVLACPSVRQHPKELM